MIYFVIKLWDQSKKKKKNCKTSPLKTGPISGLKPSYTWKLLDFYHEN